jgi:hypothetical protein
MVAVAVVELTAVVLAEVLEVALELKVVAEEQELLYREETVVLQALLLEVEVEVLAPLVLTPQAALVVAVVLD